MDEAFVARAKSTDTSTQIGVVIYSPEGKWLVEGYNTFPRGVSPLAERFEKPLKYLYTEHAERNAIYSAARQGIPLEGSTLFMVGMGPPSNPCTGCARAIIQAGIIRIVGYGYKPIPEHWTDDLQLAGEMIREAGIEFVEWSM
jgi:dCMP deaminase